MHASFCRHRAPLSIIDIPRQQNSCHTLIWNYSRYGHVAIELHAFQLHCALQNTGTAIQSTDTMRAPVPCEGEAGKFEVKRNETS